MIYLDFDGTITDIWERYFGVFCEASGISSITKEDYVMLKRSVRSDSKIAKSAGRVLPDDFSEKKKMLQEDMKYLRTDKLIPDRQELIDFMERNDCYILSKRRFPRNFFSQLEGLQLECLKDRCIVLDPDGEDKKSYLAKRSNGSLSIVGDSAQEYDVSELPDSTVYLVNTGLRNPEGFQKRTNVKLIDSINDLIKGNQCNSGI